MSRNLRMLSLVLMISAALGFVAAARPVQADPKNCIHVSGTFYFTEFTFTGPTTATAEAINTGDLAGTAHANYFNIEQAGNGVTHLNGMHTIVTPNGKLYTSDESLILPDNEPGFGRPNSRLYIIGGTDKYEGATGLLHTHGRVNLVTLEGGIDYKGQICLP